MVSKLTVAMCRGDSENIPYVLNGYLKGKLETCIMLKEVSFERGDYDFLEKYFYGIYENLEFLKEINVLSRINYYQIVDLFNSLEEVSDKEELEEWKNVKW